MMKKYLLLFSILFFLVKENLIAQLYFDKYYGTCDYDEGYGLVELQNKDLILTTSFSIGGLIAGLQLAKIDSSGNLLWAKRYTDYVIRPPYEIKKYKNNLLITCYFSHSASQPFRAAIIEIDTAGIIQRAARIDDVTATSIYSFDVAYDNSIIITGGLVQGVAVLKLDSMWNFQWAKGFEVPLATFHFGSDIIHTSDSSIVVFGVSVGGWPQIPIIIKLDMQGNVIWKKWYDSNINGGLDIRGKIVEAPGGGFFICSGDYLFKADSMGNMAWCNYFPIPDYNMMDLQINSNNELVVLGKTAQSILIFKTDLNGQIIWSNTYYDIYRKKGNALFVNSGNEIFVCGSTNNGYGSLPYDYENIYFLKTDSSGFTNSNYLSFNITTNAIPITAYTNFYTYTDSNQVINCFFQDSLVDIFLDSTDCIGLDINEFSSASSNDLIISPNPANSQITITCNTTMASITTVEIYNVMSQNVKTLFNGRQIAGKYQQCYDISKISPGIYFVKIFDGKKSYCKKLIVE